MPGEPTGPTEPVSDRPRRISGEGDKTVAEPASDRPRRLSGGPDGLEDLTPPTPQAADPSEEDKPGDGKPVSDEQAKGFERNKDRARAMANAEYPYHAVNAASKDIPETQISEAAHRGNLNRAQRDAQDAGTRYDEQQRTIKQETDKLSHGLAHAVGFITRGEKDAVNFDFFKGDELVGLSRSTDEREQAIYNNLLTLLFTEDNKAKFIEQFNKARDKRRILPFPRVIELPSQLGCNVRLAVMYKDGEAHATSIALVKSGARGTSEKQPKPEEEQKPEEQDHLDPEQGL